MQSLLKLSRGIDALNTWIVEGTPPPKAPRIQTTGDEASPFVLDADGNVKGGIRTPQTLAWDLRYARQFPEEDGTGRRIVLATDRPINFREARNQARTMDYPFTIVEIRLNKEDRGEGKILLGTKIFVDKNRNLTLENYGQQPIRFNEIRRVK